MSVLKGWFGEIMSRVGMGIFLDSKVYRHFHNVIVPASNGTTQVDHVIVSRHGLFVIETKNMQGWIFGSEDQPNWTQVLAGGKKYPFQNPLRQNYRHTKCLEEYLELDARVIHSVVFFIGDCTFKTPMPSKVVQFSFNTYIKSHREVLLSEAEVQRIVNTIQSLKADPSLNKQAHLSSLRERHASTTVCPKCGGELVKRTVRQGENAGSSFLGCSGFPKCRFTKAL